MGFQDFISDSEAAHLVGVSISTLNRFCEAGYLSAESDSDGLRLFSKAELAKVFSVDLPGAGFATTSRVPDSKQPYDQAQFDQAKSAQTPPREEEVITSAQPTSDTVTEINFKDSVVTESSNSKPAPELQVMIPQPTEDTITGASHTTTENSSVIERELARFKQLVHMQERLLDLQDDQLREIRKERDWLRNRIERLEDKQERDQLLLLSETQTIRKLVANQEQKKSSLQYALEWFGLATPTGGLNKNQIGRSRLASTIEATHTPSPKSTVNSDALNVSADTTEASNKSAH